MIALKLKVKLYSPCLSSFSKYILDMRDKLYFLVDKLRQKNAANEDDNNKCTA